VVIRSNIQNLRSRAGITQEELALAVGVDRSAVAKWETGVAAPRVSLLPAIAEKLQCTIDELLRGGGEKGGEG